MRRRLVGSGRGDQPGLEGLFDLAQYGVHPDIRILGVEADVSAKDSLSDGQHDFHWFDANTANSTADVPAATTSQALQVSFNGSNTGVTGIVGSQTSILFSKTATGGVGPSVGGYRATAQPFSAVDMSGATVTSADSATSIGFNFNFYGTSFSQVWVGDNGTIRFGNNSVNPGAASIDNADLSRPPLDTLDPARPGNIPMLAALWDFLSPASTGASLGQIRRKSFDLDGIGGADMLAIEWTNYVYNTDTSTSPDTITFQVALHADGRIFVNYVDLESSTALVGQVDLTPPVSGGVSATVGLWKGTTDNLSLPVGKYVPGPHSLFGSRQSYTPDPSETNDNYVRLAWDTGGAAWDLGVVVETSATSAIANRLRDDFVDSLGDQIARKAASGMLRGSDQILLALNLGGSQVDLGTAGVFREDDGDFAVTGGDSYPATGSTTIDLKSNAIPSTDSGMQTVFRSGRGERSADASPSNDHVAQNVAVSVTHIDPNPFTASSTARTLMPNGRYVVELFFADTFVPEDRESAIRKFDVVLEGVTYLQDYTPQNDFAEITTGTTEFTSSAAGTFSGIVKRFEVNVSDSDGAAGLQINLNRRPGSTADPILSAVRVLRADAARIEDVVVKGSDWAPGVEYSFANMVGDGQQLRSISTASADTIEIHFSAPVTLSAGALTLDRTTAHATNINGLPTTTPISGSNSIYVDDYSYDPINFIARWQFKSGVLANGKYAVKLDASAVASGGLPLDGDWVNDFGDASADPDEVVVSPDDWTDDPKRPFIAGDGTSGGAFRLNFAILAGDFNGDGIVTNDDSQSGNGQFGDGDGDGVIETSPTGDDFGVRDDNIDSFLPLRKQHGADLRDNEKVGTDDLALWRMRFAVSGSGAVDGDIDGNGVVNGSDLLIWQGVVGSESAWYLGGPSGAPAVVGDFPPWVTNVVVSGSLSLHAPFSFATVDGSGAQLATVPVGGADTITIAFSEAVNVTWDDLVLVGLRTGNVPTFERFAYDPMSNSASWRFEGWALADQYVLVLSDDVTDVDGNRLDGEWTNPAALSTTNSAVSEFPSGDGDPGGWFTFVMSLMPGDANLDGVVNSYDVSILSANFNGIDKLFTQADFNGDGVVNVLDYSAVSVNWGQNQQNLWLLADLDGDFDVDDSDLLTIADNAGLTGADWEDGDLDGDGEVTEDDLDLALAQYGLYGSGLLLNVVS